MPTQSFAQVALSERKGVPTFPGSSLATSPPAALTVLLQTAQVHAPIWT